MYSIWFTRIGGGYEYMECATLAIAQYEWDCLNNTKGVYLHSKRP